MPDTLGVKGDAGEDMQEATLAWAGWNKATELLTRTGESAVSCWRGPQLTFAVRETHETVDASENLVWSTQRRHLIICVGGSEEHNGY